MIEGILRDEIIACSGWSAGRLRAGCFHRADETPDLLLTGIARRRTRS